MRILAQKSVVVKKFVGWTCAIEKVDGKPPPYRRYMIVICGKVIDLREYKIISSKVRAINDRPYGD